jgi:hypothetical protein
VRGAAGTPRCDPRSAPAHAQAQVIEVFYRPPENFLQGMTLLTVLRRRLNPSLRAEPAPAA